MLKEPEENRKTGAMMMEETSFELRKFVAPEFVFGIDARMLAGRYAKNFGGRQGAGGNRPWSEERQAGRKRSWIRCVKHGLDHVVYDAVTSNPKAEEVMRGAEVYRRGELQYHRCGRWGKSHGLRKGDRHCLRKQG